MDNNPNTNNNAVENEEFEVPVRPIGFQTPFEKTDFSRYENLSLKIEFAKEMRVIDKYNIPILDDQGKETGKFSYNPNSTEYKHIIRLITEELPELDENKIPTGKKLMIKGQTKRIEEDFNLSKETNPLTGEVQWIISKDPRGKLWAFMRKKGVKEHYTEFVGKIVTLTLKPAAKAGDDRMFVRMVL